MPAARTTTPRHARQSPFPNSSPSEKHHHATHPDVINLSSSGDELPPSVNVQKHPKPPALRPKSKSQIPAGEVIEISSGDEDQPPSPQSIIADLQRKLKNIRESTAKCRKDYEKSVAKYRKDNEKLYRELTEAKEEAQLLKAAPPRKKGKIILDETQLEDQLSCEICTMRQWTPYTLPGCGHTFCQSCLQDWFGTTLAQFMGNNPNYDVNQPHPHLHHVAGILADPRFLRHPQITQMLSAYMPPQPQYTCPTCREPVKSKPVENFALKGLVRMAATAAGESSPSKINSGKGKASAAAGGLWDGFFPKHRS